MRKKKTVVIIQARESSTRFPFKIWAELGGKPIIRWVVEAAKNAYGVDAVLVAAPDVLSGDPGCPVITWSGPENDVLGRIVYAARTSDAGIVVRLTSDCPFVKSSDIGNAIRLLEKEPSLDYATNILGRSTSEGAYDGFDVEALPEEVLRKVWNGNPTPEELAHVTLAIRANLWRYHVRGFVCLGIEHGKWSVDTPADLERLETYLKKQEVAIA